MNLKILFKINKLLYNILPIKNKIGIFKIIKDWLLFNYSSELRIIELILLINYIILLIIIIKIIKYGIK